MNRTMAIMGAVLVAVALGVGYWWGSKQAIVAPQVGGSVPAKAEQKVLYYRNPMGLPDTSPVPKKDPMGMDYVPVYEGDEPAGKIVKISVDKVQKLGVKTEPAAERDLTRTVRAVGTLQPDERRLFTVAPRFEGWIQRLYVNSTGAAVARGQPLMDVYSPDLVSAQQEYLIASKGLQSMRDAPAEAQAGMRDLMESSLQRLRNWDISAEEVERLRREGKPRQYLTLRSQASGIVMEKPSVEGKRFMAGDVLYQIADLSSIWLVADVFEQDLGLVHPGQMVTIKVDAYPEREFAGRVTFVYPSMTPETRTAKVRVEMPNPGQLLKPAMYARVEMAAGHPGAKALAIPDSAILDTGTRQLVLIRRREGAFEPRVVKMGARGNGYVEILEGLNAGDNVVVSANFLIDAESNIKAALSGLGSVDAAKADGATSKDATTAATPGAPKKPAHAGH